MNIVQIEIDNLPAGVGSATGALTPARRTNSSWPSAAADSTDRNGTQAGKDSLNARRGILCQEPIGNFIVHDIGYDDAGAITDSPSTSTPSACRRRMSTCRLPATGKINSVLGV